MRKIILALMLLTIPVLAVTPWTGRYEFFEHAEPNQSWTYTLLLKDKGSTLTVDGFQTRLRYRVTSKVSGTSTAIAYAGPEAENTARVYPPGTVLFTLTQTGGTLTTKWGALQPNLPDSAKQPIAFEKK